jgi:hypothetical protein
MLRSFWGQAVITIDAHAIHVPRQDPVTVLVHQHHAKASDKHAVQQQ